MKYGIPTKIIEIKSLYDDGRSVVRWGGSGGRVVPGGDGSSARICAITHTVRTGGGLGDEENDEEQKLRPKVDR